MAHESDIRPYVDRYGHESRVLWTAECRERDCPWRTPPHFLGWTEELAVEHREERGRRRATALPNPSGWSQGLLADAFYEVRAWPDRVMVYATVVTGKPKSAHGRPVALDLRREDAAALRDLLDEVLAAPAPTDPLFRGNASVARSYERDEPIDAGSVATRSPAGAIEARVISRDEE